MAASAPHQESAQDRDGRTKEAWDAYRASLADLAGRDYEDAERDSWDELQRRLQAIEGDHRRRVPDVEGEHPG